MVAVRRHWWLVSPMQVTIACFCKLLLLLLVCLGNGWIIAVGFIVQYTVHWVYWCTDKLVSKEDPKRKYVMKKRVGSGWIFFLFQIKIFVLLDKFYWFRLFLWIETADCFRFVCIASYSVYYIHRLVRIKFAFIFEVEQRPTVWNVW